MKTRPGSKSRSKSRKGSLIKKRTAKETNKLAAVKTALPYASFEVANFRCFDTFKIDSLNRINLITGVNNCGKTTLLEALFLHIGARNPTLSLIINGLRGLRVARESTENQWTSLFGHFRDSHPIKFIGTSAKGSHRSLKISIQPSSSALGGEKQFQQETDLISGARQIIIFEFIDEEGKQYKVTGTPVFVQRENVMTYELRLEPPIPHASMTGIFISGRHGGNLNEEIQRFSNLRKKEKDTILLDALKIIEPRLEKIEILNYQGASMLHGYLKGYDEPVPSPLLGDGVRRALMVILAIGAADNGVVLVDEIENGIHHSAMKSLWSVIAAAAKTFNCQFFATTHSDECIRAGHDALKDSSSYELMLYRLDRINGSIQAVKYDEEALSAALSIPLEVRGWPAK